MTDLILVPGAVSLADWRAIYRGATPSLDHACAPRIAESAAARLVLLDRFFFGGGQEKTEKMLKFQPHSAMFGHVFKLRFLFT